MTEQTLMRALIDIRDSSAYDAAAKARAAMAIETAQNQPAAKPRRFRDALSAQGGACNVIALANSLAAAAKEANAAGCDIRTDAAVRLIAHQIGYLLNVAGLDGFTEYADAIGHCEREAAKLQG